MASQIIFTTVRDLRNWVDDHIGDYPEHGDVARVTQAIQDDDHPAWGEDWSEYLESLPEVLVAMIEDSQ